MSRPRRFHSLIRLFARARVLVIGDVMLDQYVWGGVSRISPEAPVPVLDFTHESHMPGGAANVARNLTALGARCSLFSVVGEDPAARRLRDLLEAQSVDCSGLLGDPQRQTGTKTRIIAQHQQVVRVDRESRGPLHAGVSRQLMAILKARLSEYDAVIVADYGKGVLGQELLDFLKRDCRSRSIWLSLDPKPVHRLRLHGVSLITPNRKEAFELARTVDADRVADPLADPALLGTARKLLMALKPALLLITLGEQGMLLCRRDAPPQHIPTMARDVFDVSGAGDTVIACFTLAVVAGASPLEAAILSNHAAGIVVGKIGTATVTPKELQASFGR